MDRGIASFTILTFLCFHLFLFLFTFSYARNPFDATLIDVVDHTNHDPLSLYENNLAQDDPNSILIPTDKPQPQPATLIHWETESKITNSKTPKPKPEIVDSITDVPKETSKASEPNASFTSFSFRPIDPRKIPRHPLPLTFGVGHRCHHHHDHHYKLWKPRLPRREIPRRNDVTFNGVELDKELDRVGRDWARQVPATEFMRLRHVEPMSSRERNLALDRNEFWRRLYRRHHRHSRHEPRKKDTGLMKRIRKFFNHF